MCIISIQCSILNHQIDLHETFFPGNLASLPIFNILVDQARNESTYEKITF